MNIKLKYPHVNTHYIGRVHGVSCYLSIHLNNEEGELLAFNNQDNLTQYEEQAIQTLPEIMPKEKALFWLDVYKLAYMKGLLENPDLKLDDQTFKNWEKLLWKK
jgi:hypothetical protein